MFGKEFRKSCIVCVLCHDYNSSAEIVNILIFYLFNLIFSQHHRIVDLSCIIQFFKRSDLLFVKWLIFLLFLITKSLDNFNRRFGAEGFHVIWQLFLFLLLNLLIRGVIQGINVAFC